MGKVIALEVPSFSGVNYTYFEVSPTKEPYTFPLIRRTIFDYSGGGYRCFLDKEFMLNYFREINLETDVV